MRRSAFPRQRDILIVSDYPIQSEVDNDIPYSSASNTTMLSDLHKAGLPQKLLGLTYLSYERPSKENFDWVKSFSKAKNLDVTTKDRFILLGHQKDVYVEQELYEQTMELLNEIRAVAPKIVVVTGKWSFFFLTGLLPLSKTQGNYKDAKALGGLSKYRASICKIHECFGEEFKDIIVYPVLPAVTKQRQPEKYPICQWDYLKLAEIYQKLISGERTTKDYLEPNRELILGTSIEIVSEYLMKLSCELEYREVLLSVDIETRYNTIDCVGLCYEKDRAICIPFSTLDNPNYWSFDDEFAITTLLIEVLTHKNCKIVGQNFSYDSQFFHKFWLVNLQQYHDTMVGNHVLYNSFQKSLDFLASIYCEDYSYWKGMQNHSMEEIAK